jgi:hypothetical protein
MLVDAAGGGKKHVPLHGREGRGGEAVALRRRLAGGFRLGLADALDLGFQAGDQFLDAAGFLGKLGRLRLLVGQRRLGLLL